MVPRTQGDVTFQRVRRSSVLPNELSAVNLLHLRTWVALPSAAFEVDIVVTIVVSVGENLPVAHASVLCAPAAVGSSSVAVAAVEPCAQSGSAHIRASVVVWRRRISCRDERRLVQMRENIRSRGGHPRSIGMLPVVACNSGGCDS